MPNSEPFATIQELGICRKREIRPLTDLAGAPEADKTVARNGVFVEMVTMPLKVLDFVQQLLPQGRRRKAFAALFTTPHVDCYEIRS